LSPLESKKRRTGRFWGSRRSQPVLPRLPPLTSSTVQASYWSAVGVEQTTPSCLGLQMLSIWATVGAAAIAAEFQRSRQPATSPAPTCAFAIPDLLSNTMTRRLCTVVIGKRRDPCSTQSRKRRRHRHDRQAGGVDAGWGRIRSLTTSATGPAALVRGRGINAVYLVLRNGTRFAG